MMFYMQNDLVDTMANIVRLNRNSTEVMQSKQSQPSKPFTTTSDHNNNENRSSSSINTDNKTNNSHMNSNNKNNNNSNNNGVMFANEQSLRPQSIKNHNDIERNENELQQRKKFSTPRWSSMVSSSSTSPIQTQQINNCDEYAVKVNIYDVYTHTESPKVYRAMDFLT